jgi:hypothetical protein
VFEGGRVRLGAVVLGDDGGVAGLEAHRGVDPHAVGEPHLGPSVVAGAVGEDAQRDVRGERRVGGASGGAEEGDDLVERGALGARAEERQRGVDGERGDGEIGARCLAAAAGELAEHAHGEGGLVPGGRRDLHGWLCVVGSVALWV